MPIIRRDRWVALLIIAASVAPGARAVAQGKAADYQRAESVHERLDGLVVDAVDTAAQKARRRTKFMSAPCPA